MVGAYRLNELGYLLPSGVHVLPPEDVDAISAATGVLQAAEARAAAIVSAAEDAFRARSDEGYRAGQAQAQAAAAEALLAAQAALDRGLRDMEGEVTRLVADCVRKLMLDFDDEARARATVRASLRTMRREKRAELRVSPAQVIAIKAALPAILAEFPEVELIDVVEDAAVLPPKIVLETRVGRVEADMGLSLDALERMIRTVIPASGEAAA